MIPLKWQYVNELSSANWTTGMKRPLLKSTLEEISGHLIALPFIPHLLCTEFPSVGTVLMSITPLTLLTQRYSPILNITAIYIPFYSSCLSRKYEALKRVGMVIRVKKTILINIYQTCTIQALYLNLILPTLLSLFYIWEKLELNWIDEKCR